MMRSLFSGVTGLKSHQTRMDVIGNNIANVNTMGFKKSSVTFKDLYSETISASSAATGVGAGTTGGINAKQIGLGAQVNAVTVVHTAGSAQYTGNGMDVAISGDGFFIVETPEGTMYTRAGNFSTDQAGNLVTQGGHYVQVVAPNQKAVEKFSATGVNDRTLINPETGINAPDGGIGVIQQGNITANLGTVEGRKFSFRYEMDQTTPWTATMQAANFLPKGNRNVEVSGPSWSNVNLENAVEAAAKLNSTTAKAGTLSINFTQEAGTVNLNVGSLNLGSQTLENNAAASAARVEGVTVANLPTTPEPDSTITLTFDGADDADNTVTFRYNAPTSTWVADDGTFTTTPAGAGAAAVTWNVAFDAATGSFGIEAAGEGSVPNPGPITVAYAHPASNTTPAPTVNLTSGNFIDGAAADTYALLAGEDLTLDFGNGFTTTVKNTTNQHWTAEVAAQQITNALMEGSGFPAITLDQNGEWSMYDDLDNRIDTVTVSTTEATGGGITGDFLISTTEFGNFTLSVGSNVVANEQVLADMLKDSEFSVNVESEWAVEYSSPGSVLQDSLQNLMIDFDMYGSLAIDSSGAVVAQLDQDTQVSVDGQLINKKAGDKVILGYVALANFNNPSGLEKTGDNLYSVSANSGEPAFMMPGTGNAGTLSPSNLEMSNVDLSEEIVNMIITQRGFQANSRIITTTDTMLEELVNLKR